MGSLGVTCAGECGFCINHFAVFHGRADITWTRARKVILVAMLTSPRMLVFLFLFLLGHKMKDCWYLKSSMTPELWERTALEVCFF